MKYEAHLNLRQMPNVDGYIVEGGTLVPLVVAERSRHEVFDLQVNIGDAMRSMDMPSKPKYVTFKAEHWNLIRQALPQDYEVDSVVIRDAVVIRRQDVLAPAGLYAYAHAARDRIDLMSELGMTVTEGLEDAADYFAGEAERARLTGGHKLPD